MKHHIQYLIYALLSTLLTMAATSCEDDLNFGPNGFGEGEATVSAEVTFTPLVSALGSRAVSGGTPGNAIKNINQLWVVVFDSKGKLYGTDQGYGSGIYMIAKEDITESENSAMPDDALPNPKPDPATGQHQAEQKTVKASFKLPVSLPYGNYRMYAVANVNLAAYAATISASDNPAETLKNIQLDWNSEKVAENNQMFGYFTTYSETDNGKSKGFDAPLVTLATKTAKLRAWLKRAASKVTIAFDARNLKENIYIYLKTAEIKDIPAHCSLGAENKPGTYSEEQKEMNALIANGQTIKYVDNPEATNYNESWTARLTNGSPIFGFNTAAIGHGKLEDQIAAQHGESVNALYFYENMQGEGTPGTASDKWQVVQGNENDKTPSYPNGNTKPDETKPDETNPDNTGYKDAKIYGTYIEVKAYYISNNPGDMSQGEIIYRFMLGKDTHLDYNAERNHHYKLTMRFNGYANDVDWHIEYPREPGMVIPNPYYISYLYNHSMMMPLQINTEKGVTLKGLKAEILNNNWAPANPDPSLVYWYPMNNLNTAVKYNWNGFLSLHQTASTVITNSSPYNLEVNKTAYENPPHRGMRTYFTELPKDGSYAIYGETAPSGLKETTDKFTIQSEELTTGNVYKLQIPMYTRAKQLVKPTGYTGNNPYVAYQREAIVKFTAILSDKTTGKEKETSYEETVVIKQVRRLVNPKGVYRKSGNTKSFHVLLTVLPKEEATQFEALQSEGPWRAYVLRGTDVASIKGANVDETITYQPASQMTTLSVPVKSLYGKTGSNMEFDINFDKDGCAVIRVEYHNFSCYHLIFVQKGDAPVQLVTGGASWYKSNMIDKNTLASEPCDEGSMFKFGNWEKYIPSSKNKNSKSDWINITPEDFINNAAGETNSPLTLAEWDDVKCEKNPTNGTDFGQPARQKTRLAQYEDYRTLYATPEIEQGYGVMYSDAATSTLLDVSDVYGYDSKNTNRGMRGCFVYNSENGANIFFPIGASGYGHRKASIQRPSTGININYNAGPTSGISPVTPTSNTGEGWTEYHGLLRYMCNPRWGYFNIKWGHPSYPQGVNDSPLFFDLFRRPGAIYWLNNVADRRNDTTFPKTGNTYAGDEDLNQVAAWDFNYFTFDFYPLGASNLGNGNDACFVRCCVAN